MAGGNSLAGQIKSRAFGGSYALPMDADCCRTVGVWVVGAGTARARRCESRVGRGVASERVEEARYTRECFHGLR